MPSFQVSIVPKRHSASWLRLKTLELEDLAKLLQMLWKAQSGEKTWGKPVGKTMGNVRKRYGKDMNRYGNMVVFL